MKNLVFIAKGMPNKIKSAGDLRALNMIKILSEKYHVIVIAQSADYGDGDLKALGCETFKTHDVKDIIINKNPEVIILSHWTIANRYVRDIRCYSKAKIVVDSIDLEFLRIQRMCNYKNIPLDDLKKKDKVAELAAYRSSDLTILASKTDEEELSKVENFKTTYLPCLYTINQKTEYVSNKNSYIICNWTHEPNIEATTFLCEKVIPFVDTTFFIVGKHVPEKMWDYASDKIVIHGVEYEIEKFLNNMTICLAPTFYGAGINGKIGEALSFGIPVITTTMGAVPYGLKHKESVMIADNAEDFIDCVNEILKDESLRNKLRTNAKEIMKKFTVESFKESFLNCIE
jgi:O-antigen biosynthesis protein